MPANFQSAGIIDADFAAGLVGEGIDTRRAIGVIQRDAAGVREIHTARIVEIVEPLHPSVSEVGFQGVRIRLRI